MTFIQLSILLFVNCSAWLEERDRLPLQKLAAAILSNAFRPCSEYQKSSSAMAIDLKVKGGASRPSQVRSVMRAHVDGPILVVARTTSVPSFR